MKRFLLPSTILLTSLALSATATAQAAGTILFRDNFSGRKLDALKWSVGKWTLDRARLGLVPKVSRGFARLQFRTYDARRPGEGFQGTEIFSKQEFAVGEGLELEARVRVNPMPAGLVTSFFTYTPWKEGGVNYSDEIDFEFLSKMVAQSSRKSAPVLATSWSRFDNDHPDYDDVQRYNSRNVNVRRLDLARFNTIVIRWLPHRVDWLVNGRVIRSTIDAVPTKASAIRMNFWAPGSGWTEAFSSALVPAKTPREGRTFSYDVDYVEVRRISP